MILGHFPQVRWYQVIDPQLVPRFIALFAAGWAIRTASRRSRSLFSAFFGTQKGLLQEWFFEGAMVVEHIHIIWSRIRSLLIWWLHGVMLSKIGDDHNPQPRSWPKRWAIGSFGQPLGLGPQNLASFVARLLWHGTSNLSQVQHT